MNELKKELSKLSGIDFFNPKYREVFKKYFPNDKDADEEESVDKSLKDDGIKNSKQIEDKVEDINKAEDEREIDKIEENKADSTEKADEKAEDVNEESKEIGKDVDELKEDKTNDELLDAKIELELMRNGVRPERIGSAKKLAKVEVHSIDELDKVKDLIKEYPEWVRGYKAEGFGMNITDDGDDLTEEEKRLKQMGINPRD